MHRIIGQHLYKFSNILHKRLVPKYSLQNVGQLEQLGKWRPKILCRILENLENARQNLKHSQTWMQQWQTTPKSNIRAAIQHTIKTCFRVFLHNCIQVRSFRLHTMTFCRLQGGQKAGGGIGHHPHIYIYIYIYYVCKYIHIYIYIYIICDLIRTGAADDVSTVE